MNRNKAVLFLLQCCMTLGVAGCAHTPSDMNRNANFVHSSYEESTAEVGMTNTDGQKNDEPKNERKGPPVIKPSKEEMLTYISGLEDEIYVLEGTKNPDLLSRIKTVPSAVSHVGIRKGSVDTQKSGTYDAVILFTFYEAASCDRPEEVPDEYWELPRFLTLRIPVRICVVTEEEARKLKKAGTSIITDGSGKENRENDKEHADSTAVEPAENITVPEPEATGNPERESDPKENYSGEEDSKKADPAPEHRHTWVEQTETVSHEEEGHYEKVTIEEAWDEPVYEEQVVYECYCGERFDSKDGWNAHAEEIDDRLDAGEIDLGEWELHSGFSKYTTETPVDTIHHEAVVEKRWVVDTEAWEESVVTGYVCSSCGEKR